MKDLKLPEMSKEEREKAWGELKPGDKIIEITWNHWNGSYEVRQHQIVKRTPKGSLRLNNGELLKEFWSSYHVITEELLKWFEKVKLESDLVSLAYKIAAHKRKFRENLEYEDALKLKEILEKILQVEIKEESNE